MTECDKRTGKTGCNPAAIPGITRLILVRHGETDWNRTRTIQGQHDIPLNETGLAQAQAVARRLASESIGAIYSSDLARARETARAVAEVHRLAVIDEPGLRERHWGRFQGYRFDEIEQLAPEAHARMLVRDPAYELDGGGESITVLVARVRETLDRLARAHAGVTIVAVAHGGVLDAAWRIATGLALDAPRAFALPNAALNVLEASASGWTVREWAVTGHLDGLARYDELSER